MLFTTVDPPTERGADGKRTVRAPDTRLLYRCTTCGARLPEDPPAQQRHATQRHPRTPVTITRTPERSTTP